MGYFADVLWFAVIALVLFLWWATLYKLLPLYRAGAVQGGWRVVFQVVIFGLSWITMWIAVWGFWHSDVIAVQLSVLWAIAGLSWAIVATTRRARRTVFATETTAATPTGYTVRTQPRRAATGYVSAHGNAAGRSARSQAVLRREVKL
jgi:hypothetical protein